MGRARGGAGRGGGPVVVGRLGVSLMAEAWEVYPLPLCQCGQVMLIAERELVVRVAPGTTPLIGLPGWNHWACGRCRDDFGVRAWSDAWRICILEEEHDRLSCDMGLAV